MRFTKENGCDLNYYAMASKTHPTTIYANFFQKNPHVPILPDKKIQSYLQNNKIKNVICGHQPHGVT